MARFVEVLTVCGVGFGTSLLLRMAIEDILSDEGYEAKVAAWDSGTAKGQRADMIVCSRDLVSHLEGFTGKIVPIIDITDKKEIKEKFMPVFLKVRKEILEK